MSRLSPCCSCCCCGRCFRRWPPPARGGGETPWRISLRQQEEREAEHADGNEDGERGGKGLGNHMLGLPVMALLWVNPRVRQERFSGADVVLLLTACSGGN